MQILKILLVLISFIGYYLYSKRKLKIIEEFIPICVFSTIGVFIFLSGILNFMKLMTILICLLGITLFIKEIYILIENKEKIKVNFNTIIFILFAGLFAYLLKGVYLIHYDNFSHWALVVKEILSEDRFPNFNSSTIMFKSYPTGTACFIYYICKFVGQAEEVMLFAQSILILASIYTVFTFCNKSKKINYLFAIILTIYVIIGNIFIDQLLVDTVLAVMGIAGLSVILKYKNDSKKRIILFTSNTFTTYFD